MSNFFFRDGRAQILSSRNRGWYDNWEKGCKYEKNMEFQQRFIKVGMDQKLK